MNVENDSCVSCCLVLGDHLGQNHCRTCHILYTHMHTHTTDSVWLSLYACSFISRVIYPLHLALSRPPHSFCLSLRLLLCFYAVSVSLYSSLHFPVIFSSYSHTLTVSLHVGYCMRMHGVPLCMHCKSV